MSQQSGPLEMVWYFDFISPFAYLQHVRLKAVQQETPGFHFTAVPVLLAGLLQYHGHKGPAEIPAKKELTFRYCQWYANRHSIPFQLPATHPFNPLALLRLAIRRQNAPQVIDRLFRHVWVDSAHNPTFNTPEAIERIPGFEQAASEFGNPDVKWTLRHNTDQAIAQGVFGVPTLRIGDHLFWGLDMTEMALEHWTALRGTV